MADPAIPSFSSLTSDLSGISAQFDPQIASERHAAQGAESRSVGASEQAAGEAEKAAGDVLSSDEQLKQWVQSTPSRQVAYKAAMHAAPMLSLLTALGGKLTRLNGQQMLGATTGIVQGLNSGAEKQYEDAYTQWNAAYQRMKEHQAALMKAHELMLGAYQGRADAYQKAAEAARRMTGDLLDEKQTALGNKVNLFKTQSEALDRLENIHLALGHLNEQKRHNLATENQTALSPRAQELLSELAREEVPLPAGMRAKGTLVPVLNSIAERYPKESVAALVDGIRSNAIDMKVAMTEAGMLGRKEAAVSGALNTLTNKGGLFDQLDAAAKKVNLDSDKVKSQLRLYLQGHAIADEDVQNYRNLIADTKSEVTQVLSRSGIPTDIVRRQADEMFPLILSYGELQVSMQASRAVAQAVLSGNAKAIEMLKAGKSWPEVAKDVPVDPLEGRTATGRNGEKYVRQGGQWVRTH